MRAPNLANTLFIVGLLLLVLTFLVPSWAARRVARVETRAVVVARALLEAALVRHEVDLDDDERLADELTDPLRAACRALRQLDSDLPTRVRHAGLDLPGPVFGNRHYLFLLTREPPPTRPPPGYDPEARRPLEVYAWPRTLLPPGRSTFFVPEVGRAAFTRNLSIGYKGLDKFPPAGVGRPRDPVRPGARSYRARDDERWIFM
jgi:hypothetical protein